MDTAGIRETHDLAEQEGVRRSLQALEGADIVIAVIDGSRQPDAADRELIERIAGKKALLVINKADALLPDITFTGLGICVPEPIPGAPFAITCAEGSTGQAITVSARNGQNIEALKDSIKNLLLPADQLTAGSSRDDVLVANIRHKHASTLRQKPWSGRMFLSAITILRRLRRFRFARRLTLLARLSALFQPMISLTAFSAGSVSENNP